MTPVNGKISIPSYSKLFQFWNRRLLAPKRQYIIVLYQICNAASPWREWGCSGKGRKHMLIEDIGDEYSKERAIQELQARVWCFENDVNILQVTPDLADGSTDRLAVVLEYAMLDIATNKKAWAKMAIMADPDSIMNTAKNEVKQVRASYYASKQQ